MAKSGSFFSSLYSLHSTGDVHVSDKLREMLEEVDDAEPKTVSLDSLMIVEESFSSIKWGKHHKLLISLKGISRYISGEKGHKGIFLDFVPRPKFSSECICRIRVDLNAVTWQATELIKVMKSHSLHYTILNDNCWKYAHDISETIVKKSMELKNEENSIQGIWQHGLQDLEHARPILPSEAIRSVLIPSDERSQLTRKRLHKVRQVLTEPTVQF